MSTDFLVLNDDARSKLSIPKTLRTLNRIKESQQDKSSALNSNFNRTPKFKSAGIRLNDIEEFDSVDGPSDYNDKFMGPVGFTYIKKYHNKILNEDVYKITKRAKKFLDNKYSLEDDN